MFRQVEVCPSQTKYQKILWKDNMDDHIKTFVLKTISYGMASSSYLATKVLQQLALDERQNFPLASQVVMTDFYMDDCLSGTSNLPEFYKLTQELNQLLLSGGMHLHKWCTNVNMPNIESKTFPFDHNNDSALTKTLGMLWDSKSDTFQYKVKIHPSTNISKREILSQISKTFDPLGLIQPVIIRAKMLMQRLWLTKVSWHENLPTDIVSEWNNFAKDLPAIELLKIPRCVIEENTNSIILNGFADSSQKGYGAVTYLQISSNNETFTSRLLCSKSRVAPLKTLTIPRLELQACLLLSRLVKKVLAALKLKIEAVRLFTDSTIALQWLNTSPHLLKVFVANRVSEIQQLTKNYQWYHIPSKDNPADIVSRGLDAETLLTCTLWWLGPDSVLTNNINSDPVKNIADDELVRSELKSIAIDSSLVLKNDFSFIDSLINLTNSFIKLIRILAFIFRFSSNCKKGSAKRSGALSSSELLHARNVMLHMVQERHFMSEISALKKGLSVHCKSKLRFVHPFIDSSDLLRVGGRLDNSNLSFDRKHPIILPADSRLTKLIFTYFHKRDLHSGPQALLNTVRQTFWPINGRNIARQVVHNCVPCFKAKPITVEQIMGNLPPVRVSPSPPFSNSGIDLCGPFQIKFKNQRRGVFQKTYVVIFICMVTKAVHFETVSDLTSDTLIAALKRFFGHRGKCSSIYSDNASNFTGADAELKRMLKLVNGSNHEISNFLSSEGIEWKFLPPRAPNFAGLWESGVKSFKFHLKRTVGSTKLTLEEFLTVTVQIEGILNSRPLSPLSTDSTDFEVLTPGHFLIGRPLNALAEPELLDKKDNLLGRWQRTQKMVQAIWKAWQNSYLSHLQQRNKWLFRKPNLQTGMLVLIKDEQLPVCKWSIGRIIDVIPGPDGNIRVANVRTPKGNIKRAISKLSILPIVDNAASNLSSQPCK